MYARFFPFVAPSNIHNLMTMYITELVFAVMCIMELAPQKEINKYYTPLQCANLPPHIDLLASDLDVRPFSAPS